MIHRLGMVFVTTLKSNRLVSSSQEQYQASREQNKAKGGKNRGYVHLDALDWDANALRHGQQVKLQEMPFLVRLFKLVARNGDIDPKRRH